MCQGRWPNFKPMILVTLRIPSLQHPYTNKTSSFFPILLIFPGFFSLISLRVFAPLKIRVCDLNTFSASIISTRVELKNHSRGKVTNENVLFSFPINSSTLNSLQIKIQTSPSTSVSSLSELSPISSEIAVNSPSASSSQSTADLNDVVLAGKKLKLELGQHFIYLSKFDKRQSKK